MTQLAEHEGLIVPAHVLSEERTPPEEFVRRLQQTFGADLLVTWNAKKRRWVIEQCVEHLVSLPLSQHSHVCRRIYVWLVRDEATGDYMPLGDAVIAKLHEMDTYRKYGQGPEALKKFQAESRAFDVEQKQKQREQAHSTMEYLKKWNRVTRNRLKTLMGRHDWLRPNK